MMGVGCWGIVVVNMVDDLLGKMVDVDDKAVIACLRQLLYLDVEERLATDRHQCFRHGVGQGFQSCAESCGQYHCLFHGN